jgi:hypothetical protein
VMWFNVPRFPAVRASVWGMTLHAKWARSPMVGSLLPQKGILAWKPPPVPLGINGVRSE